MRELKFRGIDKNGNFVFGGFARKAVTANGAIADFAIIPDGCYAVEVGSETVGQFSESKDSQGVCICENDILRCENDIKWIVSFKYSCFIAHTPDNIVESVFLYDHNFKVIGNIHQHKHLLEE